MIGIGTALKEIQPSAFYNCEELKKFTFTTQLDSVGETAFYGCIKLEEIDLPATIKVIGKEAFYLCRNLQTITCRATTPPKVRNNAFDDKTTITVRVVKVPSSAVSTYRTRADWRAIFNESDFISL